MTSLPSRSDGSSTPITHTCHPGGECFCVYEASAQPTPEMVLVEAAVFCVTAALNCPAHPWYGSDTARKWLMDAAALRADS